MFAFALTALLALSPAVHSNASSTMQRTAPRHASVADPAQQLIDKARASQIAGDFETARNAYMRAIGMQRADGLLSIEASYGAADVLSVQGRHREAADVLEQLAADANLLGDAETEARVLLDVVAVKIKGHRRAAARAEASRLLQLVTDERISGETRRLIRARLT